MACDGLHSTVRRQVGLDRPARSARRPPVRHPAALPRRAVERPGRGALGPARRGVRDARVATDVVGVALLGPQHHDYDRSLDAFPALRRHLGAAPTLGPPRGAGPLLQRTQARTAGRVRLVGDASGYVDALTGEGVRVGLAQAAAAVRTLGPDVERSSAAVREGVDRRDPRLPDAHQRPGRGRADRRCGARIVPLAAAAPGLYGGIVERLAR